MIRRVPLAWRNLTHHRRRLVLSVLGVAFAVMLMFMQLGFFYTLLDSTTKVIELMDAEIVLISPRRRVLSTQRPFERRRLLQAAGHPDVTRAEPVYIELYQARLRPENQAARSIRVLSFDILDPPVWLPELMQATPAERSTLLRPGTAWVDRLSKRGTYGLPFRQPDKLQHSSVELAGQKLDIGGTFELGTDFVNRGNVLMSPRNFARYFSRRGGRSGDPLEQVDVGLIQLRSEADIERVRSELQRLLGSGVTVLTKAEFLQREKDYWLSTTPIGFVFSLMLALGFIVGVVVCYQVIFSGLSELQAEFATVKAIGYTNRFLIGQVLGQGIYLSVLSFIPGWVASVFLFRLLSDVTGLTMTMTPPRVVAIFAATVVMCMVSGCLAVRKVLEADPADLF